MSQTAAPPSLSPAPREVELKLEFAEPGSVEQLLAHPLLRKARASTEAFRSVYFDTPALDLRAAGLSLRIRHRGARRVQTIKAGGTGAAGLFDRNEWERDVEGDEPDIAAAQGTALEPLLAKKKIRKALAPIFTVTVERTTCLLASKAWAVELALDQGKVEGRGRSRPLTTVELELKRGEPVDLFRLAQRLADPVPLRLGARTKADEGFDLALDGRPAALKARNPELARGTATSAAFQVIARACLHQIVGNERLLRGHRSPDALHQMRVGLRRLRAAVSLFRDVVGDDERDGIAAELKWIFSELGRARDLDVFKAKVLGPVQADHPERPSLAAIADGHEAERAEAYRRVLEGLESQRFRTLVLRLAGWIEAGPWLARPDELARARREEAVEAFATRELARRRKKLRKKGEDLADLDAAARHEVRIAAKKLRYAAEFFASLFERKGANKRRKALFSAMEELQEHLGDLNDMATGEKIRPDLTRLAGDAGQDPEAERLIASYRTRRHDGSLGPAVTAYERFSEVKPFWT